MNSCESDGPTKRPKSSAMLSSKSGSQSIGVPPHVWAEGSYSGFVKRARRGSDPNTV